MDQAKLLYKIARFNMSKVLVYPWEIGAFFTRRIISAIFLIIFWFAVANGSSNTLNFKHLVAYFLVSGAVQNIIFSNGWPFGKKMYRMIKNGEFSNYLIKPISIIPFLFFGFLGENWMAVAFSVVSFSIGIIILPPAGIFNILLFLIFLFLALIFSLSINLFLACASFHIVEISGIKNSIDHVREVLSGSLIPLTLFPIFIRQIVMFSPFPLLAFTPTYVLQNSIPLQELFQILAVSLFWSFGLFALMMLFWKKSLKHYEGVGI